MKSDIWWSVYPLNPFFLLFTVPHLLQSVKNLQYDKGFYPTLDCDFLIEILTTDIALKLVLPTMLTLTRQTSLESKRSDKSK